MSAKQHASSAPVSGRMRDVAQVLHSGSWPATAAGLRNMAAEVEQLEAQVRALPDRETIARAAFSGVGGQWDRVDDRVHASYYAIADAVLALFGQEGQREAAPVLARDAEERGEGICRTCLLPIWNEGGTIRRRQVETGWSDRIVRGGDSLVCFKAREYRHVPLEGREADIYDRAHHRGREGRNDG